MIYQVTYQEHYSRGELLLRTFFGFFYILLPHTFLLLFMSLWGSILTFISFWIILFTGRYPESFFEFQVDLIRWNLRVNARLFNLADGYPSFGVNGTDEYTKVEIKYPEQLSRGMQIIKLLFGAFYVGLPHGFILIFYTYAVLFVQFINFWIVLFTGKMSRSFHDFILGYMRWSTRVNLYLGFMTDKYPPFTGREIEDY